ncbi:MerR family transcriptional regulator [Agreia bicolorata]|uniref:Peroxiredoxin n=1 Tax=Agreia bicolorata TaxID=110935 RepID=A0ABR5CG51_9MICO|nr:MerR family transcriptional regulator [Agreia bicolorata]KJC64643.1 hypothetical protein TZ00_09940 [Agreia bicolorata]
MEQFFRSGQVADEIGVSPKALRGYEQLGLIVPSRDTNGYRLYDRQQVAAAKQVHQLNELGIPLRDMAPFVDCMNSGSIHADACPSSLAEYRRAVERIDRTIETLTRQRDALVGNLAVASRRLMGEMKELDAVNPNLQPLPADLPAPEDDGAADHLAGMRLPPVKLPSTDGDQVDLDDLGAGRVLIYVFAMTGSPEQDMPDGWDAIPGARGCSPHNCDVRDHYADLIQAGVRRVFGLSGQPVAYQQALAEALRLPYPLLTDERMLLAAASVLPTFSSGDVTAYRRLALIVRDNVIEHVFYPVFPADRHAQIVLDWLEAHPE